MAADDDRGIGIWKELRSGEEVIGGGGQGVHRSHQADAPDATALANQIGLRRCLHLFNGRRRLPGRGRPDGLCGMRKPAAGGLAPLRVRRATS